MADRPKSIMKTLVWGIIALVFLGLGGLGVTNFSATLQSVATVGDEDISTNDYARALNNEMQSLGAQVGQAVTFQMAQTFGIPQQVLSQQVAAAALREEAARIGLSIGDDRLADALRGFGAFQGSDGQFDRDTYAFVLRNAGLTEAEFEEDLRADNATALLQGAITSGVVLTDTYVDTLIAYLGERRSLTYATVTADMLEGALPEPDDAELQAHYDANIDAYTRPRTKQLRYVWISPDMIVDSVEVEEDRLQAAYDERFDEFNVPERRLVERLAFLDSADADAAAEAIAAGETTFEDLVAARGLDLSDTDLGDVSRDDLGEAAEAVFAAETGDVLAAPSDLGPALYRVNGVLAAQSTTLAEAEPELRAALALDRARRVIEAQSRELDDELAAGATLEELANVTDLELGTLDWTGEAAADIAAYPAFRAAADAATAADYPQIETLGDGGLFALEVTNVLEPAPYPFDEVRDAVITDWLAERELEALLALAEDLRSRIDAGAGFLELGLTPVSETDLVRDDRLPDLPQAVVAAAFELTEGATQAVTSGDQALIVQLDAIAGPDTEAPEVQALANTLRDGAASDVANDLLGFVSANVQERVGVSVDQAAINAVHAQMQ